MHSRVIIDEKSRRPSDSEVCRTPAVRYPPQKPASPSSCCWSRRRSESASASASASAWLRRSLSPPPSSLLLLLPASRTAPAPASDAGSGRVLKTRNSGLYVYMYSMYARRHPRLTSTLAGSPRRFPLSPDSVLGTATCSCCLGPLKGFVNFTASLLAFLTPFVGGVGVL